MPTLSLTLLALLTGAEPQPIVDSKKIDALIERTRTTWHVPGTVVLIVDGEKILYLNAFGLRDHGKKGALTPDTIFPLASCSKAFTTTLMAMLVDEGKLGWDDPVRKHLPDFRLADPLAESDVRLRDLVSHRTGVAGHDMLWYRAAWDQKEMIRRVGKLPLDRPFRTAMQYQSIMFIAAGHAASHAAGASWEGLVTKRIFEPLGMKHTTAKTLPRTPSADVAAPHKLNREGAVVSMPRYDLSDPNPAGSIHASARDLAPWLQLHLNAGKHGEKQLVSASQLRATHTPQTLITMEGSNAEVHPFTQQMSYGMAWVIQDYRGELLVSHAGIIDGIRVHFTLLPKRKLGLAILCNLDQTRMNLTLSNQLVDLMIAAPAFDWNDHYSKLAETEDFLAKQRAIATERARQRGTKPSLPLDEYAGSYEEPAYGVAKIRAEGGELQIEWSSFRCKLEHFQHDIYRVLDDRLGEWPVEFVMENGKVKAMRALNRRFVRLR